MDIAGEGVYREISSGQILLDGRGELNGIGMSSVAVDSVDPEGSDLETMFPEKYGYRSVLDPCRDDVRKKSTDLLGEGVSRESKSVGPRPATMLRTAPPTRKHWKWLEKKRLPNSFTMAGSGIFISR
jgi:hypothetical protein